MRLINATMPRSGSEFVSKLILQSLHRRPECIVSITPGRNINHQACLCSSPFEQESSIFRNAERSITAMQKVSSFLLKIESPGRDTLCMDIAERCTDILWLCSLRNIEDIVISHYNLKSWGWTEDKVLQAWKNDLFFYEFLHNKKRLLAVDIDNPDSLSPERFCQFLGLDQLPDAAEQAIASWGVVNPLKQQKEKAGEAMGARLVPESISTIRFRHPWIEALESRYQALLCA
ncbi:hypothetical protein [Wenzhouxiangella sp. EGI_FJ10305]|uniref:hypothetical protein n=1 Tax=Wenzhouxiangella sp. EGI_FJ10305 TaxID=3243768 RepID=UPI0035DA95B4